jgi:UDP-2,3-diacylglucosamine pyrophosphatase LpxH
MASSRHPATKIVLSDLHMGAGYAERGNTLEDFTKDREIVDLLAKLRDESETLGLPMELILNGDIFEFWQVPALREPDSFCPEKRYPIWRYLGTREEDSRRRMALIVRGHREVFRALAGFLHEGSPRRSLSILRGNHDVQLYWPAVQATIRQALAPRGWMSGLVNFPVRSLCRDGVYVEHGSEYADALNRHAHFERPRHPCHKNRLRMVPGGPLSIHVINGMERDHYWISSVKPVSAILWYLLRFDLCTALRLILLLLPHLPRLLWLHRPLTRSNRELARELRSVDAEMADHDGASESRGLPECFAGHDGEVGLINLPSLTDVLSEEEAGEDPLLVRGLLEEHTLHARMLKVAQLKVRQEQACVVLFGHTHLPAAESLEGDAVYINTGSWTWMLDLRKEPAETWRRLIRHQDHQDVHYRLTYARVDYGEDGLPRASLSEVGARDAVP